MYQCLCSDLQTGHVEVIHTWPEGVKYGSPERFAQRMQDQDPSASDVYYIEHIDDRPAA